MRSVAKTTVVVLAVSIAAAAIVLAVTGSSGDEQGPPEAAYEDYRIPAGETLVEPDRPDLFEELGSPEEQP